MKVGLLTLHSAVNPGAFLQAYCSQLLLESMGHEVAVLNYEPRAFRATGWRSVVPGCLRALAGKSRYARHRRAAAFRRVRTAFHETRPLRAGTEVSGLGIDVVVVGSDIVWDYQYEPLVGEQIYFGHGIDDCRVVAFAASCGGADIDMEIPGYVRAGLRKFHSISVRDAKTARLVEIATGEVPEIIADPTFCARLDALSGRNRTQGDYLLVYAVPEAIDPACASEVREFARRRSLRIVSVTHVLDWADENVYDADPFEWLTLFRDAAFVFTNTFHGTLASVHCGRQFVTQYTKRGRHKTRGALASLRLEERAIQRPGNVAQILERSWAVEGTRERLYELGARNRRFLSGSLGA